MYVALRVASHLDYRLVCLYVCPSVTIVHPANAVGWNEMPFDRDVGLQVTLL